LVRKWTKLCEKLQKKEGEGFGIQLEVGERGTEISEVLRPDAAWRKDEMLACNPYEQRKMRP
jgi:hypothetical protein